MAWFGRQLQLRTRLYSTTQSFARMDDKMKLSGAFTALVTPFTPDGSAVDYEQLKALAEWQIQEGIDGLVPMGTTGEWPTVSPREREKIVAQVVNYTAGRVPVIAGTGSNSTVEALRLTQAAKDAGADGCMVGCPYYNKPTQKGMIQHFTAIADIGLPVVLYNNPSRTGICLTTETIVRLAQHPHIVAVKDATGSLEQASEIAALCDLTILSGEDNLTLPMMAIGATGVMSVFSNVSPAKILAITRPALQGDFMTARKAHLENIFLVQSMFLETNPQPLKVAMELLGKCSSVVRLPLIPCEPSTVAAVKAQLKQAKLL